jgi:hypothetical protein
VRPPRADGNNEGNTVKDQAIQTKANHDDTAARQPAAGPNGAAAAPPAYGIDFLDRPGAAVNRGGLPDKLKTGMESLSGLSMDDVRVHYHSDRPARLGALAYTQGTNIYVGPGQEQHLAHEAWHVVQQKEGRVRAAAQVKGVPVNDDPALEREADHMGDRSLAPASSAGDMSIGNIPPINSGTLGPQPEGPAAIVQRAKKKKHDDLKDSEESDDESSEDESKAEQRKKRLKKSGYNVDNSTPASGYVIKGLEAPQGRTFQPKNDEERLDQLMRQMTTGFLEKNKKGVEFQAMFIPDRKILLLASNKTDINQQIFKDIQKADTFPEYFQDMTSDLIIEKPGKTKRGKQKVVPKAQRDNAPKRRSTKFNQRLASEKRRTQLKDKKHEKSFEFVDFLTNLETSDIHQFDATTKFEDSKMYILKKNATVQNSTKEEHAEVNFFPLKDKLGLESDEFHIAGPKCPCATCRQKGFEKGAFDEHGDTGKLFPGQLPMNIDKETFDEAFLQAVAKRQATHDTTASANYQYLQSESELEFSSSDSD